MKISTVPIKAISKNSTSVSKYSEQGWKHFLPWYLEEQNAAENLGYLKVVVGILKKLTENENKGSYTFLRGDVNIFMPWIRVRIHFNLMTHIYLQ